MKLSIRSTASENSPIAINKMKSASILIVDDDPELSLLLSLELEAEGYRTQQVADGQQAVLEVRHQAPDLVILDRLLPGFDGLQVCKRLRLFTEVPILMLTSLNQTHDKVSGLYAGANDYLTKPFEISELLARVHVLLRTNQSQASQTRLAFAGLQVDLLSREVRYHEQPVVLSGKEFELLLLFLKQPRQVLSKTWLIQELWQWDYAGQDNILEVHIYNLRKKLAQVRKQPVLIQTVRGVGYVLKEA